MTEFIRGVGSEPETCLWVSVAVPVHVFSLSSGKAPFASEFMSKLSHCVGPLILIQVFLSSADLVTAFRLVFVLLRGISLDWTVIKERLPRRMAYLTLSFVPLASFSVLLLSIFRMLCQYHELSPSSITPAARSTRGL